MKKYFGKIGALVLAGVMVMAMSVTAFAAYSNDQQNDFKGIVTTDTTIGIAKQIVFINDETTPVREPNIVYTYTIDTTEPGTATVTDSSGMSGKVKAGPLNAVSATTATVTFTDTKISSANSVGINSAAKYANFTFIPAAFGAPGIYRYKISETTNVSKASVGITEAATYAADRFLDVYVKWTDDAHTTLGIYGYVLYERAQSDSINSNNVAMKSTGYVNTSASGQADVDVYTTCNLYINKVTTGALADKNHDFPITVTLTAPTKVSNVKLDVTKTGEGALTTSNDLAGDYVAAWGNVAGTVRNGSQIAIKGIPSGATVSIVEKNDTYDSYKVKAGTTSGAANLLAESIVAAGTEASATNFVNLSTKSEIHFTNTLEVISPTGLFLRFTPFLVIIGAAVLLLLVSRRRGTKKAAGRI